MEIGVMTRIEDLQTVSNTCSCQVLKTQFNMCSVLLYDVISVI